MTLTDLPPARRRLSAEAWTQVMEAYARGDRPSALSKHYGVSESSIYRVAARQEIKSPRSAPPPIPPPARPEPPNAQEGPALSRVEAAEAAAEQAVLNNDARSAAGFLRVALMWRRLEAESGPADGARGEAEKAAALAAIDQALAILDGAPRP